MRRWGACAGMIAVVAPAVAAAAPDGEVRWLSLPAQPLSASLQAIARRYGIELLFSHSVVGSRSAPPVADRLSAQAALNRVLEGSGLVANRTADGSFIVTAAPAAASEQAEATPELLVVGRRTQNTDVRRTRNDVRPLSGHHPRGHRDGACRHAGGTGGQAAARQQYRGVAGATGASAAGSTASSINLRGLGTDQTLILIDGRRLPMMPATLVGFNQSDVNALPPESIERVEAITATAGGIHGPGATAGVVNIVLRRDYRGIDMALTSGITARGDAPYRRADVRFGFTPDGGTTDIMVDVGQSRFDGLDTGDRDYQRRANDRILANQPGYYVQAGPPSSAALTVTSADGKVLVLKPGLGGASLGAPITFAPPMEGRSVAELARVLAANAGRIDTMPAADEAGARQTLLSARRTTSIIASARHRAGPAELFVDFLRLDNDGRARMGYGWNTVSLGVDDPTNPFAQAITVHAPGPTQTATFDFRSQVTRLTGGAIVDLPGSWRAEADYSR